MKTKLTLFVTVLAAALRSGQCLPSLGFALIPNQIRAEFDAAWRD